MARQIQTMSTDNQISPVIASLSASGFRHILKSLDLESSNFLSIMSALGVIYTQWLPNNANMTNYNKK